MVNRTSLRLLLLLSWLCRDLAIQLQAGAAPDGALILLAGRAKCGTSHLHKLLASHQSIFSLRKEQCPKYIHLEEGLFAQLLNFTASLAQAEDGSWLRMGYKKVRQACADRFGASKKDTCWTFYEDALSGGSEGATRVLQSCIRTADVIRMQNLVPVANARVLFLQRDPADLLWSAYNFWQGDMDANETRRSTDWAGPWTSELNYRSPVHFHELVASQGRLVGGVSDWHNYSMIPEMHQLRETFGRGSVLFLRSEDMHRRETIQKLCDFVGVSFEGLNADLIGERTNTQGSLDRRGVGLSVNTEEQGIYEVSGFKPMLCETRELIYKQAQASCSELDTEFGLHYPECLGTAPACVRGQAHGAEEAAVRIEVLEAEIGRLRHA